MHKTDQKKRARKREEALEKDDYDAAGAHDAEMTQFASKIDEEEVAKASSIEKLQEDFETAKERWDRPFEMKKDLEKEAGRFDAECTQLKTNKEPADWLSQAKMKHAEADAVRKKIGRLEQAAMAFRVEREEQNKALYFGSGERKARWANWRQPSPPVPKSIGTTRMW